MQPPGAKDWRWGVPYEHDLAVQRFVAMHPGGATLDEIGNFFGVSHECVRQIEAAALKRLRKRAESLQMMEEVA